MGENTTKKNQPEQCLSCGSKLAGRLGKKFCSDQCRAQFNNRRKVKEERWIQQLNRILRKNRSVLKNLNPVGQSKVRQEVLKELGFDRDFYGSSKGIDIVFFIFSVFSDTGKDSVDNFIPYRI